MKKLIISILTICIILCGCGSNNTNNTLTDKFKEFHLDSESSVFYTSRGTEFVIGDFCKENTTYEPNVVLSLYLGNTDLHSKVYNWCTMSIEERKADLKECSEMVIEYAKSENWDNDYYLYINIYRPYNGQDIVYNYEEDFLYLPDTENIFLAMYEQFGTMSADDLEEMNGGIDFLINNNLAYLKHNEIEYKTPSPSGVDIYEGEFRSFVDFDGEYSIY